MNMNHDLWPLILPGILLGLYAQIKLSAAYGKYVKVPVGTGVTGAEAARDILDRAGLADVAVMEVPGHLTDHYDPLKHALFLSSENYHGRSLAAVGVAAHEAGHALQHQAAYAPLQLRMMFVPIASIASQAVIWIFVLGMVMSLAKLAWAAVAVFGVITVFQLITLPVEFDASRRAKAQLLRWGLIDDQELPGVSVVLNAAALTYVAAMIQSAFELLRWVMLARNSSRD